MTRDRDGYRRSPNQHRRHHLCCSVVYAPRLGCIYIHVATVNKPPLFRIVRIRRDIVGTDDIVGFDILDECSGQRERGCQRSASLDPDVIRPYEPECAQSLKAQGTQDAAFQRSNAACLSLLEAQAEPRQRSNKSFDFTPCRATRYCRDGLGSWSALLRERTAKDSKQQKSSARTQDAAVVAHIMAPSWRYKGAFRGLIMSGARRVRFRNSAVRGFFFSA